MTCNQARERFGSLNVWRRGGERAPHKPLLLLLTLARIARGGDRLVHFGEVEEPLRTLLVEFGPPRKSQNPHAGDESDAVGCSHHAARNASNRSARNSRFGFFTADRGTVSRAPCSSCNPCRSIGPSISSSTSRRTWTR
jgi:hypothetical protein